MGASEKQSREAETKWRRHVEEHKKSGLSANEYCRGKGLDSKYFSLWRRRLRERRVSEGFVRITPQEENEWIKIETPKGYRIEVGIRFDERVLKRLIEVLSQAND